MDKEIEKTKWSKIKYNQEGEDWKWLVGKSPDEYELQLYIPLLGKSIIVHQIPFDNTGFIDNGFKPGNAGEWVVTFLGGKKSYYNSPKISYKTPQQAQIAAKKEIVRAISKQLNMIKKVKP